MSTPVSDYAGLPFDFALGEVYGLRTWRMDDYGRLRSLHVTTSRPWRPGVNEATCHRSQYAAGGLISSVMRSLTYSYTSSGTLVAEPSAVKPEEPKPDPEPEPPHLTPMEGCACGFYAYTDQRHEEAADYRGEGFVVGIVSGTGRTLIGTKGFRSEKAEIVALLDPTRGGKKTAHWRGEQLAKLTAIYPDVPLIPTRAALLEFAPIEPTLPEPGSDEFWSLP